MSKAAIVSEKPPEKQSLSVCFKWHLPKRLVLQVLGKNHRVFHIIFRSTTDNSWYFPCCLLKKGGFPECSVNKEQEWYCSGILVSAEKRSWQRIQSVGPHLTCIRRALRVKRSNYSSGGNGSAVILQCKQKWGADQAATHGFPTAEQPQLNQQQLLSHKQAICEGASQDSGHRGTLRFITQEDGLDICLLSVSPFSHFLYPPPQGSFEQDACI